MHEKLGLPAPNRPGIFRLSDEVSVEAFRDWAKELRLLNEIRLLNEPQAKFMLGAFYQRRFTHFQVPDTLFREADLMNKAREIAKENGVHFRKSRVKFTQHPTSPTGFLISTDDEVVEPKFVVLCAGRGILSLLNQLGVEHPLAVFQSCLLRIRCGDVMQTPLMVDLSYGMPTSGLSVVQHSSQSLPPDGCLVIGSRARRQLREEEIPLRRVTPDEDYQLRSMAPQILVPAARGHTLSIIACCKTEALDEHHEPSVNPWVRSWPEHPGLVAVVPGKATLALYAAYEALKLIEPCKGYSSLVPPGAELSDPFIMHQEHEIDELDGDGGETPPDYPKGIWIN